MFFLLLGDLGTIPKFQLPYDNDNNDGTDNNENTTITVTII